VGVTWRELSDRFIRTDGAEVVLNTGPAKLHWVAYEPSPSQHYLARPRGRFTEPRRWRTAAAAMRAVDRERPLAAPSFALSNGL
jgi:hypothetical protein